MLFLLGIYTDDRITGTLVFLQEGYNMAELIVPMFIASERNFFLRLALDKFFFLATHGRYSRKGGSLAPPALPEFAGLSGASIGPRDSWDLPLSYPSR